MQSRRSKNFPFEMLSSMIPTMDPFAKEQDEFAMYQKCHRAGYIPDYDRTSPGFKDYERRAQGGPRQNKKMRQSFDQHEYYVALFWNPVTGKISKKSSSALRCYRDDVLAEALPKFSTYLQLFVNGGFSGEAHDLVGDGLVRSRIPDGQLDNEPNYQFRPNKRRKGGDDLDVSDSGSQRESSWQHQEEDHSADKAGLVSYRADAHGEWEKWFYNAFRAVQQVSCRVIAKEWIKTIHPKKQSTHPYNGKNPRTGERGDSNSTKPPYWPKEVIHKEPDHINKEARTKLLVYLLMNTPHQEMSISGEPKSDKEITAATLRESLDQKKHERQNTELLKKFNIVEHIIDVRSDLEAYEYGGIAGSTVLTAPDYSDFSRTARNDEDSDEQEEPFEMINQEEAGKDVLDAPEELTQSEMTTAVDSAGSIPQQEAGSERERKYSRGGRRSSAVEENCSSLIPAAQQTPHPWIPPPPQVSQSDYQLHPPMILPHWETFQANPAIMTKHESNALGSVSSHTTAEAYHPVAWPGQAQTPIEATPQFVEHCMISPVAIPSGPQAAYIDTQFPPNQPHALARMSHPQYRGPPEYPPENHVHRQLPVRGPTTYETFMVPPSASHEMMQRAYYQM